VWLLDPTVTHLNHGSYGACPRPVVDAWQGWQRELERSPTELLTRRLGGLLDGVRATLAELVGARPGDLTLVRNATSGLNAAIRSLPLGPDDEVVTTTYEYGALVKTWNAAGARLVGVEPDAVAASIGPRTRVVFVSHITSDTARLLPVAEICAAARNAGALAIVDGAHAPGHLSLDLHAVGADVYAGNCHKWLCAPKGSAFLWARAEHHRWLEPVVTSWGWAPDAELAAKHEWQGTFDPSAWLTIPTAIDVWRGFDLRRCRALAEQGRAILPPVEGVPAPQMWATELPPGDAEALKERLFDFHRIEVPVIDRDGRRLLRVSVAPYNDDGDLDRLVEALRAERLL
jgi:isopenicillin-N epimerase